MIEQALAVLRDRLVARLPETLATMPGSFPPFAAAAVRITSALVSEAMLAQHAQGGPLVVLEQDGDVVTTWPLEGPENETTLDVAVHCIAHRAWLRGEEVPTDEQWAALVRTFARGVRAALCRNAGAAEVRDGVLVQPVTAVREAPPNQGDDAGLTVVSLTVTVPVTDYYMLGAES